MREKLTIPLLLLLFMLVPGAAAQDLAWLEEVDAYLEKEIGESSLPGAAVAVVDGDEILYARGFGFLDRERSQPVTAETPFEIGSLTKSMTALAVLQLAEEGRLELDAPVQRYLPWFRVANDSDRHLLTHTSGLPTSSHAVVWRDVERISGSIEEGVRELATVELTAQPGERLQYANMGYSTLGAVVEAVSGRSWADYVRSELLVPLGMGRTGLTLEDQTGLVIATPHTWRLARQWATRSMGPFVTPAGSTPVSSARDMGAYLQAWLEPTAGGVVSPWAAARATEPLVEAGNEHYGLGLVVVQQHGEEVVYHTGGTIGSASYMAFLPGRDLGVVVLSNSLSTLAPTIGRGVIDIALGEAPRSVGADPARVTSVVLTVIGVAGFLLLILLGRRIALRLRAASPARRSWVLWLRAGLLSVVAALLWTGLPRLLAAAGMPVPFGVRGYPFDIALGVVSLLLVSTLWAAYSVATLLLSLRGARGATRPTAVAA